MPANGEKILLVESDPDICDLIGRQALLPLGLQVRVVNDAASAIKLVEREAPDVVIVNVSLPGLSGKDLLVALGSQGTPMPMIVLAEQGREHDLIQAFRLGASDYLLWPARDFEVVSVVERALKQVREHRARLQLDQQLQQTNQELQRKVHELTSILSIGKAVVSITDQRELFDHILTGSMEMSGGDLGWLMLRDERSKSYNMAAQQDLPEGWAKKMNQALEDGVTALVATSGETLLIHGEPLERFKIASLGRSAAVVPIKVKQEVIGLLIVVRRAEKAFNQTEQTLLEAVADYASISLVNARLFRVLQQTAEAAHAGQQRLVNQLQELRSAIQTDVKAATAPLDRLLSARESSLTGEQRQALEAARASLFQLAQATLPVQPPEPDL